MKSSSIEKQTKQAFDWKSESETLSDLTKSTIKEVLKN